MLLLTSKRFGLVVGTGLILNDLKKKSNNRNGVFIINNGVAKCEAAVATTATVVVDQNELLLPPSPPRKNQNTRGEMLVGFLSRLLVLNISNPMAFAKRWFKSTMRGLLQLMRFVELFVIFTPPLLTTPLLLFPGQPRHVWRSVLIFCLNVAGPTFQKLGQWCSTRPDLFGATTRHDFERFHSDVTSEAWYLTKKTLEEALFPRKIEDVFEYVEEKPIGCGCIAQVHRGVLKGEKKDVVVAVKIRRRHASEKIRLDCELLVNFAHCVEFFLPAIKFTSLAENAENFARFMKSQLDLRVEADHLKMFHEIFDLEGTAPSSLATFSKTDERHRIKFPKPLLMHEAVLVETFEEGVLLSKLLSVNCDALNKTLRHEISTVLAKAFLEMVIVQNYTHSDLHPGNIIVHTVPRFDEKNPTADYKFESLIFIDAGLVTKLQEKDQRNFIDLFKAVTQGDGALSANLMIDRSRTPDSVIDREGFTNGLIKIVDRVNLTSMRLDKVEIGRILEEMLNLVYKHNVKLDPAFTSLVIAVIVLEGVGRQLFPEMDIFKTAAPMLVRADKKYQQAAAEVIVHLVKTKSFNPFNTS